MYNILFCIKFLYIKFKCMMILGNPLNLSRFQKNSKKIRDEEKMLDLKNAFIRNELNLADYIYAVDICQVEILDKYITCTICLKFCHLL